MNNDLIERALACYVDKIEKENSFMRDIIKQINSTFEFHGFNETDRDRLNKIVDIIKFYERSVEK